MRPVRTISAGAALAAVLGLTVACGDSGGGGNTPASGGNSSASGAATSGGASSGGGTTSSGGSIVVENAFQLKTVDPARMFEPTGLMIDHALYDTLLTFKGSDVTKPVPDLATKYSASSDGKKFTFTLNKAAKFSDGTPVTAADVVFSLNRVKNIKGNPSFLMNGITVSSPDSSTVVLTSATSNAAIPFILANPALGIVNSKAVKADGGTDAANAATADKAEKSLNTKSQGSGPYILQSYSTTSQVVLVRNDKYWGAAPHYSKIVIVNKQANIQKLDVQKNASQIAVDLSPRQAAGVSGAQVINGASPNVFFLFTNNNSKISSVTSNKDFQQAVRYGVDYDGLVKLAGEGAVQAPGIIPTIFLGSLKEGSGVKRDVAKAKAALAASGLKNPTVTISYPSDIQVNGLNFGDLATRVQQDLKEVGINVQLKGQSVQVALDSYRSGKEEMGLWEWGPDFPDPSDYLNFLPGQLVGLRAGWAKGADPAVEALGTKAASTVDNAARAPIYQQIQQKLNESSPIMPLIQPAQVLVGAKSVKNLQSNALWLVGLSELG